MKIAVTGSNGYIGSLLVQRLLQQEFDIVCLDTQFNDYLCATSRKRPSKLKLICGDARDPQLVKSIVQVADVIVHLAAIVGYPACDLNPELARSTNVAATRSIVELAPTNTPIIFASTCSVYGHSEFNSVNEEHSARPLTVYGNTKLEGESFVLKHGGIVLRFATAYGRSQKVRLDLMPHDFIIRGLRSEKILLFQPEAIRPLIHVEDICSAIIFSAKNHYIMAGSAYNVGPASVESLSKREIASYICEITELSFDVDSSSIDPDARSYHLECRKIFDLGFRTQIPLKRGLLETKMWLENFLQVRGQL